MSVTSKIKLREKYLNGILLFLVFSGVVIICGCNKTESAESLTDGAQSDSISELPLPEVPDDITLPSEKLKYVALHFWDALDFNDTVQSKNQAFMEQNFANFALILSNQHDKDAVAEASLIFLQKASVNDGVYNLVQRIASLYLADPNSPMRDESVWIAFLEATNKMESTDEAHKLRNIEEIELLSKNRPGSIANDFTYKDRAGMKSERLHSTLTGTQGMLLVFYDTDCERCHDILTYLHEQTSLEELVNKNIITVVAINSEDNFEAWKSSAKDLPTTWIVGFNSDSIVDNDVYYLPAMPSFYILTPDYTVIAKDPNFQQVVDYIERLSALEY